MLGSAVEVSKSQCNGVSLPMVFGWIALFAAALSAESAPPAVGAVYGVPIALETSGVADTVDTVGSAVVADTVVRPSAVDSSTALPVAEPVPAPLSSAGAVAAPGVPNACAPDIRRLSEAITKDEEPLEAPLRLKRNGDQIQLIQGKKNVHNLGKIITVRDSTGCEIKRRSGEFGYVKPGRPGVELLMVWPEPQPVSMRILGQPNQRFDAQAALTQLARGGDREAGRLASDNQDLGALGLGLGVGFGALAGVTYLVEALKQDAVRSRYNACDDPDEEWNPTLTDWGHTDSTPATGVAACQARNRDGGTHLVSGLMLGAAVLFPISFQVKIQSRTVKFVIGR